jgi:biofilm PGA synthesis N-glycosyltransferase PgaC
MENATRVVAIIAAHNEEHEIANTLAALARQTRPVDRTIVMADNCTDATVAIARACGADVFETRDNTARKAGALNQGLAILERDSFDYLLQLDADTELEKEFVEEAVRELDADDELGGVCARFFPKYRPGLLGALQRLEYTRYDQQRRRHGWRVNVLSGTAAMLRNVALPEKPWSETSLVEDYVLTLDLQRRGWKARAGERMIAHTDSMPSVKTLWRQRIRWTRGTIEELVREGWQPWTRADILAHVAMGAAIAVRIMWVVALTMACLGGGAFWTPLWLLPLIFVIGEGLVTTRRVGWRDRLVLLLVIPEELYGTFRQVWTCTGAMLAFARTDASW